MQLHRWKVRTGARIALLAVYFVALVFAATGCAVKLAPDYDKAIFDGLTKANEDAMKLFASVGSAPYTERQVAYNSVIGELNAVQVQIKSRSTPTSSAFFLSPQAATSRTSATQQNVLEAPTSADVDTLIKIMETARRNDQDGRLPRRIDFIKESFAIQMAQALTYEKALQR